MITGCCCWVNWAPEQLGWFSAAGACVQKAADAGTCVASIAAVARVPSGVRACRATVGLTARPGLLRRRRSAGGEFFSPSVGTRDGGGRLVS